jgi:hypothetical protein
VCFYEASYGGADRFRFVYFHVEFEGFRSLLCFSFLDLVLESFRRICVGFVELVLIYEILYFGLILFSGKDH